MNPIASAISLAWSSSSRLMAVTALWDSSRVMQVRRRHWLIETGLHYRRGVTFREDAVRMTKGAAGRILATIHKVVLALIKRAGVDNAAWARRWFEGHLDQAFASLVSRHSQL
ncbi:hypothetical protein QYE77_10615 [Thermanaerothrix sp. 4228-RoL]|uniref:Transposase n=1 Tax=Thermanaerothrix solaris TaxID=3058434 RepID=A0ABU3NPJ0_9CHLR|nr:hypothetical protein [Thermanaerothrix sp. 4228-RoL]MDT8898722.1 hypothetical protein [Thermanaerothrix sp. 4228-RoL]